MIFVSMAKIHASDDYLDMLLVAMTGRAFIYIPEASRLQERSMQKGFYLSFLPI